MPPIPVKPSQKIAIEVLDGIMQDILGFHILEPKVVIHNSYKVKPNIKH